MARKAKMQEVTSRALASEFGCSEQSLRKWCKLGLPHRVETKGSIKTLYFEPDKARQWIKGSAVGIQPGMHGGKRAGGGRKKKGSPKSGAKVSRCQGDEGKASGSPPRHLDTSHLPPATSAPAPPAPRRLTPPRNIEAASFLPPGHPDQHKGETQRETPAFTPLTPQQLRDLTPIEVKQHLDIEKILSERVARGEKEGTLIGVEDARKEWSDACTAAARVLGKMRDTLASRIITDLGLPTERAPRLRQVIQQEAAHVLRALRTASFGPDEDPDLEEVA